MADYNQNLVFNGLGTFSITIPTAATYFVEGKISIPRLASGSGASSLVAVVNKNGSAIYTGVAGADGLAVYNTVFAAGDVLAIVLSSGAPADQGLNKIKTTISIGVGQ